MAKKISKIKVGNTVYDIGGSSGDWVSRTDEYGSGSWSVDDLLEYAAEWRDFCDMQANDVWHLLQELITDIYADSIPGETTEGVPYQKWNALAEQLLGDYDEDLDALYPLRLKTINGESIVGTGNISVSGGGGTTLPQVVVSALEQITHNSSSPNWVGHLFDKWQAGEIYYEGDDRVVTKGSVVSKGSVTVNFNDSRGSVSINGYNETEGGNEHYYRVGTVVNMVATPRIGRSFDHWELNGQEVFTAFNSGNENRFSLLVYATMDFNVTAVFV